MIRITDDEREFFAKARAQGVQDRTRADERHEAERHEAERRAALEKAQEPQAIADAEYVLDWVAALRDAGLLTGIGTTRIVIAPLLSAEIDERGAIALCHHAKCFGRVRFPLAAPRDALSQPFIADAVNALRSLIERGRIGA